MMSMSELRDRAHKTACEKGWHDNVERGDDGKPTARQFLAWMALAISEWFEAEQERAHYYFKDGKPEGKVVELADVVIRLADTAGAMGFAMLDDVFCSYLRSSFQSNALTAIEGCRVGDMDLVGEVISLAISAVFGEAERLGYDHGLFWGIIEQKMAYNETRPQRHGGKLA